MAVFCWRHMLQLSFVFFLQSPRISETLPFEDISSGTTATVPADLVPEINGTQSEYICAGGLQVDIATDSSLLLVSVCTPGLMNISGAVGFLSISNISEPASLLYGNVTKPRPDAGGYADGVGTSADVVEARYLYQTADGARILFLDSQSCARQIDRSSSQVDTVIGNCGNETLDLGTQALDLGTQALAGLPQLVNGMSYVDGTDTWLFAIGQRGVLAYTKPIGSQVYVGIELLNMDSVSETVADGVYQIFRFHQLIMHKVNHGVNMYFLNDANPTSPFVYGASHFRLLSSPGATLPADDTALYIYQENLLKIGASDAQLDLSPDEQTLLIADTEEDKLFFFDFQSGDLTAMCTKSNSLKDGDAKNCTFVSLASALWLKDDSLLAYEQDHSVFRKVTFVITAKQTNVDRSGNSNLEEGTWWTVLAITCGFCGPLFIFWIVIKVIQCRRNGFVFDIFNEEEGQLDLLTARNINFLYNKAAKGQEYHSGKSPRESSELVKKRYRKKSKVGNVSDSSKPSKLEAATKAIASKFKLPSLRQKKKKGELRELHPVEENKVKPKRKPSKDTVNIDYGGSKVSVPMTKTEVGRARPLPTIPINKTI